MPAAVDGRASRAAYLAANLPWPADDEIEMLSITCLEHLSDSGPVVTHVIAMVTKDGLVPLARQYLSELPRVQEAYRMVHGRYAENATELKFFVRRTPLPLRITLTPSGWTASVGYSDPICEVTARTGGSVEGPDCFDRRRDPPSAVRQRASTRAILRTSPVPSLLSGPHLPS